MLQAIIDGELYDPEPAGRAALLIGGGSILYIGPMERDALPPALPLEVIDATGCLVVPGFIDPHQHLIGGSGEEGFATQTPEIAFHELVAAGITTVVGCLGADTTTKTMEALIAKAKGLRQEGLTAYAWTGGYDVPPVTVTGSVHRDILMVQEVIGTGELAISDRRSSAPSMHELARIVKQTYVAGTLSGKAGVTHFHVGEEPSRLEPLRHLIQGHHVLNDCLYPTHITRNEELMQEAVELTRGGCTVDVDTFEADLPHWLQFFISKGGDLSRLTVSSDASINTPASLLQQIRECIQQRIVGVPAALSLVTRNTARILKLPGKGLLRPGADADLLLLRKEDLQLTHVWAGGKCLFREGAICAREKFLSQSKRRVELHGQKR